MGTLRSTPLRERKASTQPTNIQILYYILFFDKRNNDNQKIHQVTVNFYFLVISIPESKHFFCHREYKS